RKAWHLLQGARPCRVRASHPPVARLASLAALGDHARRTRWAKRRQRLLSAVGGTAPPAVLVPRRKGASRTPRVGTLPQATRAPPTRQGGAGPPASSGRGRQAERG